MVARLETPVVNELMARREAKLNNASFSPSGPSSWRSFAPPPAHSSAHFFDEPCAAADACETTVPYSNAASG